MFKILFFITYIFYYYIKIMDGEDDNEHKKNQTKDDGTLALGIDFGTCRISSAIWNKNKKGPQLVKDMKSQPNKIYIPAILSFGAHSQYREKEEKQEYEPKAKEIKKEDNSQEGEKIDEVGVDKVEEGEKVEEVDKKEEEKIDEVGVDKVEEGEKVEEVDKKEEEKIDEVGVDKVEEGEKVEEEGVEKVEGKEDEFEKKKDIKKEKDNEKKEEKGLRLVPSFMEELRSYPEEDDKVVYNIKQILGQKYSSKYLQNMMPNLSFKLEEKEDRPTLKIKEELISFEEIASFLFKKCIDDAEENFKNKVGNIVVSIPHSFNNNQRKAIKDSIRIAGCDKIHIINDTTAALIYYAFKFHIQKNENFLICDMGQNKLDCSVISIDKNNIIQVLSSGGDNRFGGEKFNQPLFKYVYDNFIAEGGNDFKKNPKSKFDFNCAIEAAKRNLTFVKETEINLPKIDGENDLIQVITREEFDKINEKNYKYVLECIDNVILESKIDRNNLNNVILIGESLRIPKLVNILEEKFEDTNFINDFYDAVSMGSAIYSAHVSNKLNSEKFKNFKVFDITQLSLGIRTEGDLISTILPRGSKIPVKAVKSFLTTQENQKKIKFEIYEGERKFSRDNELLCRIILKGIPEGPRGSINVEVTFEIDEDGILKVQAIQPETNIEAHIIAAANGNMEEEEIKEIIQKAKLAKSDDEKNEERVKAQLKLNEEILNYTKIYGEDENLWPIIEEYRNWLMHAGNVPKEELEKKRCELKKKMSIEDGNFDEEEKEEEKKEEDKKEEEKKEENKNEEKKEETEEVAAAA